MQPGVVGRLVKAGAVTFAVVFVLYVLVVLLRVFIDAPYVGAARYPVFAGLAVSLMFFAAAGVTRVVIGKPHQVD